MSKTVLPSKLEKIKNYNPNMIYTNNNLFGLPFTNEESEVVVIPVPWEVTVSFRAGTAKGPEAIREASYQVDLYDEDVADAWKVGIGMQETSKYWIEKNESLRPLAEKCIANIEEGGSQTDLSVMSLYEEINKASSELNAWIKSESLRLLEQGKIVGVIGGEHSVPYGLMEAIGKKYSHYSILHIDAHADYRQAYEGFEHSHASIQYNASRIPQVEKQVLLGIRDYSEGEIKTINSSQEKIKLITDRTLKNNAYRGMTWEKQCQEIVSELGDNVYISFDIDALNPALCPHTGTPVPGGLEFEQAFFLFKMMIAKNKKIVGFDICEVAPGVGAEGEWDAVIGARVLYRLAILAAKSQGKI
ncbi:MAG: agmatinase family protein [bacterium]|nr:agmatinase family protein [bacterium]